MVRYHPTKQRGKKTTLINFDTRGIRSGDAIIGMTAKSSFASLDLRRSCSQVSRNLSGQPGIPQSRWRNPFKEVIAKFEACISDFIRLSPMGSSAQSPQHSEVYSPQDSQRNPFL